LDDEWTSIAEISFCKSHFNCTLYKYILTGEEDVTQSRNECLQEKFPHLSEYKDGTDIVLNKFG